MSSLLHYCSPISERITFAARMPIRDRRTYWSSQSKKNWGSNPLIGCLLWKNIKLERNNSLDYSFESGVRNDQHNLASVMSIAKKQACKMLISDQGCKFDEGTEPSGLKLGSCYLFKRYTKTTKKNRFVLPINPEAVYSWICSKNRTIKVFSLVHTFWLFRIDE